MSGMDRLTDENVQLYADHCGGDMKRMARELLAHRRATRSIKNCAFYLAGSKYENGQHSIVKFDPNGTTHIDMEDLIVMSISEYNRRASQAAPAPDDQFVTTLPQEAFDAFAKACDEAPAPSDGARFIVIVNQAKLFEYLHSAEDADEAVRIAGSRIITSLLSGGAGFAEAVVMEMAGIGLSPAPAPSDGLREAWHKTTDGLPKKPGLKSYEQIECLIKLPNGDLEISMWNCEHEVWDDAEGDDYRHDPCKPTHWMDLAPFRAALSASPAQEGGE